MLRYIAIGPGAMGYFAYLGILSKLKHEERLGDLEEISGASAGSIAAFLFCATRGDPTGALAFSLDVPIKQAMKPNIKNFILNYGLVPPSKLRKLLEGACVKFMGKTDMTFHEFYRWHPVKIHIAAYCLDAQKTVYFSVDTTPTMSIIDAMCASVAIPFLVEPVKLRDDGWHYIDGGTAELLPGGPFIGKSSNQVLGIRGGCGVPPAPKDIKTYGISILHSTMNLRGRYDDFVNFVIEFDSSVYDFNLSNDDKLKLFVQGYSQKIS